MADGTRFVTADSEVSLLGTSTFGTAQSLATGCTTMPSVSQTSVIANNIIQSWTSPDSSQHLGKNFSAAHGGRPSVSCQPNRTPSACSAEIDGSAGYVWMSRLARTALLRPLRTTKAYQKKFCWFVSLLPRSAEMVEHLFRKTSFRKKVQKIFCSKSSQPAFKSVKLFLPSTDRSLPWSTSCKRRSLKHRRGSLYVRLVWG